ncbi:MAG: WD40/YVTN/BNR-like repeat-containing protein [Candidatus Thorarchaeota archaeon]
MALIVEGNEVWVGNFERGWEPILKSNLKLRCIQWFSKNRLLVGTAGARLAWIKDGKLDFISGFDNIKERRTWNTPWGGPPDIRSIAISGNSNIYANIHVGWIGRSFDSGKTWKNIQNGLEKDVHQVATHPTREEVVFAATAWGFHVSFDYGESFVRKWKDMPLNYQRATICFPNDDIYVVSVARGSYGRNAQLYWTDTSGDTWQQASGLPIDIEKNIDTYQLGRIGSKRGLVVIENNQLYGTEDQGKSWKKITIIPPRVNQVLALLE